MIEQLHWGLELAGNLSMEKIPLEKRTAKILTTQLYDYTLVYL